MSVTITRATPPEHALAVAFALKDALAPPHQSNFRVLCIMTYDDPDDQDTLGIVTGTNAEACAAHASFCAERTALVTLRNHPRGFERLAGVRALYLVCDGETEITPGMLCREMLASFIPLATPVWLGSRRAADGHITARCITLEALVPFAHVYRGMRAVDIQSRFAQHRSTHPPARLVDDLFSGALDSTHPPPLTRDGVERLVAACEVL